MLLHFVIRTSPEFQKLLGIAMEMFLLCSDDKESDVRMVADECLNKIIKVSHALFVCHISIWMMIIMIFCIFFFNSCLFCTALFTIYIISKQLYRKKKVHITI